jgi:AdoMet-dependent rRNA methyltransferase SPB1
MKLLLRIGLESSEDESTNKPLKEKKTLKQKSVNFVSDNPLLTDLDFRDKKSKKIQKAGLWFERDVFKDLENEDDADYELDKMIEVHEKKGGQIIGQKKKIEKDDEKEGTHKRKINEVDDVDADYDVEEAVASNKKIKTIGGKDGFEVVAPGAGKKILMIAILILTRLHKHGEREREREREREILLKIIY